MISFLSLSLSVCFSRRFVFLFIAYYVRMSVEAGSFLPLYSMSRGGSNHFAALVLQRRFAVVFATVRPVAAIADKVSIFSRIPRPFVSEKRPGRQIILPSRPFFYAFRSRGISDGPRNGPGTVPELFCGSLLRRYPRLRSRRHVDTLRSMRCRMLCVSPPSAPLTNRSPVICS